MAAHLVTLADADRARATEPRHIGAQQTARREPDRPAWWVSGHRVRLEQVDAETFLARCDCPAAGYGLRCYHLPVAVDEELCHREGQRVAAAYAVAKHAQVAGQGGDGA